MTVNLHVKHESEIIFGHWADFEVSFFGWYVLLCPRLPLSRGFWNSMPSDLIPLTHTRISIPSETTSPGRLLPRAILLACKTASNSAPTSTNACEANIAFTVPRSSCPTFKSRKRLRLRRGRATLSCKDAWHLPRLFNHCPTVATSPAVKAEPMSFLFTWSCPLLPLLTDPIFVGAKANWTGKEASGSMARPKLSKCFLKVQLWVIQSCCSSSC